MAKHTVSAQSLWLAMGAPEVSEQDEITYVEETARAQSDPYADANETHMRSGVSS